MSHPPATVANRVRYGVAPAIADAGSLPHVLSKCVVAVSTASMAVQQRGRPRRQVTHFGDQRVGSGALIAHQLTAEQIERLNAVGPLVDRRDAGVAIVLRHAGLFDETHAAMNLHRERGVLDAEVG